MHNLLLHYGYAFLVFGLVIEGDATLVAAAILAGEGYFDLRWVLALALGVTICGNEALYEVGKLGRLRTLLGPSDRRRVAGWLHSSRAGFLTLLFSRFMWGFRLVIPLAAGLLHIRRRRFVVRNVLGGLVWVGVLAYFGVALQTLFVSLHNSLHHYQAQIAVSLFLLGLVIGIGSMPWRQARRSRNRHAPLLALGRPVRRLGFPHRPGGGSRKPPEALGKPAPAGTVATRQPSGRGRRGTANA